MEDLLARKSNHVYSDGIVVATATYVKASSYIPLY